MEQWNALVTTFQTLLAILGIFTCVAGGISAITKLLSPFKKIKETSNNHETRLAKIEEDEKELKDSIAMVAETDKILCKVLLEILDHVITGNHVDRLKTVRGELEESWRSSSSTITSNYNKVGILDCVLGYLLSNNFTKFYKKFFQKTIYIWSEV